MNTCDYKGLLPIICDVEQMPVWFCWGNINNLPIRFPDFLSPDMIPDNDRVRDLRSLAVQNARNVVASRLPHSSAASASALPAASASALPAASASGLPAASTSGLPASSASDLPAASASSLPAASASNLPATSASDLPAASASATAQYPPVEPYSGQHPGEDWRAFFARREERDRLRAQKESPQAYQSRLQRIQHAAKGNVPGRKGATVYVWEDVNGFLVRRAGGRQHYNRIWQDFGPTQRRYDSFRDEWDLCEAFDPHGEQDDDDEDWDDVDFRNDPLIPETDQPETDELPQGVYSSSTDLQHHNDSTQVMLNEEDTPHAALMDEEDTLHAALNEPPDDTAYYRYGFVHPVMPMEYDQTMQWADVCAFLGNFHRSSWAEPKADVKNMICALFSFLGSANSISGVPDEICDFRRVDPGQLTVRSEFLCGQTYFIISAREDSERCEYEVVLKSGLVVLEILRHGWGPHPLSIARRLIYRGIAFNVCFRDAPRQQPVPMFRPRFAGLGYRPQNYQPDLLDYQAYENSRNRFLRSSRGRAALLRGGIIARLAVGIVSFENFSNGPSDMVLEEGLCLWDGNPASQAYWDDHLTDDEVDLICGVYRVDTGEILKKSFPEQIKLTIS